MKLWAHRYQLVPSLKNLGPREGALLKVDWGGGRVGYSDLHPWSEFGEASLEAQLIALSEKKLNRLIETSLEFSYIDGEYRRRNRNAFLGLALPLSHKLVLNLMETTSEQVRAWEVDGFTHVKLKMGKDLLQETAQLFALSEGSQVRWRIDFNARLSAAEAEAWWRSLDSELQARVDFIEDPSGDGGALGNGPWADDWLESFASRVRVIKPARESSEGDFWQDYDRVVFTHSLDHPLAQAAALWSAARFYRKHPALADVCGLADPGNYQPNDFSRAWSCAGPRLKPTEGVGFGFDQLLGSLRWERVL